MIASNDFITECKEDTNCNRLGRLNVDGIEEPITNSDNLQSFSIDSGCYVDGTIIGTVYLKKMTASLLDTYNIDLIDKTIHAEIGVKYADDSTEYINMGTYKVERPKDEETANMTQLTAYDRLNEKLNDKYVCGIDYTKGNIHLEDLYVDVCNQLGLEPKNTKILNYHIPITNNPFTNGETNRTVLETIGKVACSFIEIDEELGQVDLGWISDSEEPDYVFERGDFATLEGGKIQYGPINTVVIKNSQIDDENVTQTDEESITQNGEHSITINEDYILYNAELRQMAMPAIFERLNGFKYIDCKLTTYYGKPFLPIGAKIRIARESDYIDTYVLKHNFTYDGTFESTIESPVLTEQEVKTKQNVNLRETLRNTQITVNKQEGKINELVSEVDEYSDRISEVEQTVEKIDQKVSDNQEMIREVEGINYLHIETAYKDNIRNLTITGPLSFLYLSDNLYPSKNLYPLPSKFILIVDKTEKMSEEAVQIELPIKHLKPGEKFVVENNQARLEKVDGTVEELGEMLIPLFEGENYIHIKDYEKETVLFYGKYIIKNDYTDIFATLTDLDNSEQATKLELNSVIEQTAKDINLSVSEKVGKNEIISSLNISPEEIKINAEKISFEGVVLDLTSDSITINSKYLQIDKDGNLTCNSASLTGELTLKTAEGNTSIYIGRNNITFVDYANTQNVMGTIGHWASLDERYDEGYPGVALAFCRGSTFGIFTSWSDIYNPNEDPEENKPDLLMSFNESGISFIKGTANGTISTGGKTITVKNGLITSIK